VKREIKGLDERARSFFLLGTACSMVAMAMCLSRLTFPLSVQLCLP
jgi:hypothetical protein